MQRSLIFIFCMIFIPVLYTSCMKIDGNDNYNKNNDFILQCDSLLSICPEIVVRKIDSVISQEGENDRYYSLLLIKSKAKLFLSEYDSLTLLLDSILYSIDVNSNSRYVNRILSDVYNMRGNLYARRSIMDSAVSCFKMAYRKSSYLGISKDMIDISINLADSYVRSGKLDLGAYWYRKSLLISDSLLVPERERFPSYYGLAQVYMDLRDYNLCDYYFDIAGKYYDYMRPFEKHIYLNNRGNSYYYRGDYDKAMEYFRNSLSLTNSYPNMEYERNFTKVNMGEVFMLMNKTDSATFYLDNCYSFFKSIGHVSAIYYIETQLIELALKKGDIKKASDIVSNAVKPDFIEPNMLHIRNRYLQHYFEEIGDYKRAYLYQTENMHIDDSIRNERVKMRTAEITMKYRQDSTLMKKEIFIKEKENQVLELNQWIYILALGLLLIISFAGMFIIYRKKKSDKKIWNMQNDIASLRLENIRNRISPHFVFNVINREVVNTSNDIEKDNLLKLSKLIRQNLELTQSMFITICDELDFVRTYISLQKQSLQDFYYDVIVEKNVMINETKIPSMIIQIPVENALKHALKLKKGMKRLWIHVKNENLNTVITITDNGGGYKPMSVNSGTGTGLKVITQTIQLLNMYNHEPIIMKITNVHLDSGEIGCEIRYSIPVGYSYIIKK